MTTNKYLELLETRNKAIIALNEWKEKCIELNLTLPSHQRSNISPHKLHTWFETNFPELIYYRRISDGCMEKLELIAPKSDIISALELCMETLLKPKGCITFYNTFENLVISLRSNDSNKFNIKDFIK